MKVLRIIGAGIKEKLERAAGWAEKAVFDIEKFPRVLLDRTIGMAVIAVLILSIGIFTGCQLRSAELIWWSVVPAALVLVRCVLLLYAVNKNGYEVLEGRIGKVRAIPAMDICMVTLLLADGDMTKLLLGKQRTLKAGKTYRFYFCGKSGKDAASQTDAGTGNGLYIGCEEIGN